MLWSRWIWTLIIFLSALSCLSSLMFVNVVHDEVDTIHSSVTKIDSHVVFILYQTNWSSSRYTNVLEHVFIIVVNRQLHVIRDMGYFNIQYLFIIVMFYPIKRNRSFNVCRQTSLLWKTTLYLIKISFDLIGQDR